MGGSEVFNKIECTIKPGDFRNQIEPFLIHIFENEPEWLAQLDLFFESIFPEKVREKEDEEDEDELEQRENDFIKKN